MMAGPEIDVDGVQNGQERETPGDAVNDDALACGEELVDDGSKQ